MSHLKISVVTVTYNSAETLRETLESVNAQTHADIEHLIVDGGSSDGTMDLVRRYGHRVAQAISEPDRGIYDAMNKGVRAATGEIVGFLNADDVLADPLVIRWVSDAAESADIVYGDLVYVHRTDLNHTIRYWQSGSYSPQQLRWGWMPAHPTLYVRKDRFEKLGGFNEQLRIAADYDFVLRCFRQLPLRHTYVPRVFVKMRMGGASNRSIGALWRKSREDLWALHHNGVGGIGALLCKNLRKLPQFLPR